MFETFARVSDIDIIISRAVVPRPAWKIGECASLVSDGLFWSTSIPQAGIRGNRRYRGAQGFPKVAYLL
jgi:hypothetical protein